MRVRASVRAHVCPKILAALANTKAPACGCMCAFIRSGNECSAVQSRAAQPRPLRPNLECINRGAGARRPTVDTTTRTARYARVRKPHSDNNSIAAWRGDFPFSQKWPRPRRTGLIWCVRTFLWWATACVRTDRMAHHTLARQRFSELISGG